MIVFEGLITGLAEKQFWKEYRKNALIVLGIGTIILFPVFLIATLYVKSWLIPLIFVLGMLFAIIVMFLPKTKNEKVKMLPSKIYIRDECIVSVSKDYTDTKSTTDIKEIRDYGDFYVVLFPFGKLSHHFICQKSLITKGSVDDFEKTFEDVIIKMTNQGNQSGDGSMIEP